MSSPTGGEGGGGGGRPRPQCHLPALHPTSIRGIKTTVRWTLSFGCLWMLLTTPLLVCAESNGCDFYGSGLEQDGRGVQPVYLSCSSGRVEWQYPRAGLRVILRSPHKDRDFQACIKGDPKFEGARVYLEGYRSLLPLFALDDGRPQELVRCFTSYKGQAALYVEAEPSADDLKKEVAAFDYDLQTLAKGKIYDPLEECRPCSEDEILRLYCSGDFVARGSIERVEDDSDLATTTITIRASKLFQQTSPVFRHAHARERDEKAWESAYGVSNSIRGGGGGVAEYTGRVDVPIQCGARAGEGEFLVMGVMRLGKPILRCAPRHSEWVKIAKAARANAQCVLET